jgi:predicted MFS family arabinose efflux permease
VSAPPPPVPVPPASAADRVSAFAFPRYRRLWVGAFLSSVGSWTQDVALSWLIHTRFADPSLLGVRAFAADAPLLAFMLVGGAMADRMDRRRILLTSQVLQLLFAAALGVLYAWDRLGIEAILAIAFLTGLAQSQSAPTYQAVITSLVPRTVIPSAVALNSLQFNLSRAIGPVIAGLLLARAGTGACFAVNAVSFLAVIIALLGLELPLQARAPGQGLGQSVLEGVTHVGRSPVLRTLTLAGAAASFLAFPLVTYLPVLADAVFRTGAAGYSLLLSCFGVGAIVGAVATARRGSVPGRDRTLLRCLALFAVTTIAAMASGRQALAMPLLAVSGWSIVSAFSILNSLVQENAPDALRGRVVSIYGLAFRSGTPLGSLSAGFLVRAFGAPRTIGSYCLGLLCLAAFLRLRSKALASAGERS